MTNNKNINLIKKSLMWLSLFFIPKAIFIALIKLQIINKNIMFSQDTTNIFIGILSIILFLLYLNMVLSNKKSSLRNVKTNYIAIAVCTFFYQISILFSSGLSTMFKNFNIIILFIAFCTSFFININLQKYRNNLYKIIRSFFIITLLILLIFLMTSIQLMYSGKVTENIISEFYIMLQPFIEKVVNSINLLISYFIIVMDVNRLKFKNIEKDSEESIAKYSIYSALSIYFGLTSSLISYYIFNSDMDK